MRRFCASHPVAVNAHVLFVKAVGHTARDAAQTPCEAEKCKSPQNRCSPHFSSLYNPHNFVAERALSFAAILIYYVDRGWLHLWVAIHRNPWVSHPSIRCVHGSLVVIVWRSRTSIGLPIGWWISSLAIHI
jgi:hypothetical protein